MIAALASLVFWLPVAWARIYTCGLPDEERGDRIAKIQSDTHEHEAFLGDYRPLSDLTEVLYRVVAGVWADVLWRFERGHRSRVRMIEAGRPPFPVGMAVLIAVAATVAATQISILHDLGRGEHAALVLAVLVGPLVSILGVFVGRRSPITGAIAVLAGGGALAAAAWSTVLGPVAAVCAVAAGLGSIIEHRGAARAGDMGRHQPPPIQPADGAGEVEELQMASKLERWLALGALVFAAGVVLSFIGMDTKAHANNSDAEIMEWYAGDNAWRAYLAFLGAMAGAGALLAFFAGLYAVIRRGEGGTGYLSLLMMSGAVVFAAFFVIAVTLTSATAVAYDYEDNFRAGGIDPQTVRLLDVIGFSLLSVAAMGGALAAGSAAIVGLRNGVLPHWLAWSGAAVAVLLLLNFPLFTMPIPIFAVWLVVVGGWRLFAGRARLVSRDQQGLGAPA